MLGTAYYAEDARMMSEMAAAIGEDDEAAEYAELSTRTSATPSPTRTSRPTAPVAATARPATRWRSGMGLVTDPALRAKVGAKFVAKIAASDNHLTTGFLGTPLAAARAERIGRDDLAYTMLLHNGLPVVGLRDREGRHHDVGALELDQARRQLRRRRA